MNDALNAVRYSRSSAFSDSKRVASAATKRALLRHFADLCRWTCEIDADFNGQHKPKGCTHRFCEWVCFQSTSQTAEEMSLSPSQIKNTRRELVNDGWLTTHRQLAGRGNVTFYVLNRNKLAAAQSQGRRFRQLPDALMPRRDQPAIAPELDFDSPPRAAFTPLKEAAQVINFADIASRDKGDKCRPLTGEVQAQNEVDDGFPNKKNRNEPTLNPCSAIGARREPTDDEVRIVFFAYPKQTKRGSSEKAIRAAVTRLCSGADQPSLTTSEALAYLADRARAFGNSAQGQRGEFTPSAMTWFNDESYLEDEKEWQRANDSSKHIPGNTGTARFERARDSLARAQQIQQNCIDAAELRASSGY